MGTEHIKDKPLELIELNKLLLDQANPRFAEFVTPRSSQRDILNIIVKQFGVDDVLSSIAVSGYFSAEPLVCTVNGDGSYTVVEGNRRLVAMLILSGDERAVDHKQRITKFQSIHKEHGSLGFNPVPCVVFSPEFSKESLLSYLGVRHIVSTKQWDSYAKAAWVNSALDKSNLELGDIAEMIGDSRGTIQRLLSGFNFIKQLQDTNHFQPENSVRKGRGSNTKYPFSWVYTILGSTSVQKFVELASDPAEPNPIPAHRLENAELLVKAMFGDSSKGANPAINDSRQLGDLAKVVASQEKVAWLRDGKSVEEIERLTQPIEDMLGSAMVSILSSIREVTSRLDEEDLSEQSATQLMSSARSIKKQADKLLSLISAAAHNNSE